MLIYSFVTDYQAFNLRYKDNTARDKNETKVGKQSANLGKNNEPIKNRLSFLIDCKSVILHHLTILSFPMVRPAWDNWWLLVAFAFMSVQSALDAWWALASIFSGGMLGLFLLGYISRKARNFDAVLGVVCGVILVCWIVISPFVHANLAIVFGTLLIFLVGFLSANLLNKRRCK